MSKLNSKSIQGTKLHALWVVKSFCLFFKVQFVRHRQHFALPVKRPSISYSNILIYISNKMQRYTVYFIWKLFYMFRVVPPPIIRSANNCVYSIWNLSHRFYFFCPSSVTIFWRICVYMHISDCVRTVYELQLCVASFPCVLIYHAMYSLSRLSMDVITKATYKKNRAFIPSSNLRCIFLRKGIQM